MVLNNRIAVKYSCLWHIKGGVKHPSLCWVPGSELWWFWKRKKSLWVLTFLLHLWSLHFYSVPVATIFSFTILCSNFLSHICAIHAGSSWSQDVTLGECSSCTDLPFLLASARGRAQGMGWPACAGKLI